MRDVLVERAQAGDDIAFKSSWTWTLTDASPSLCGSRASSHGTYAQVYSSTIAPSRRLATVTMRLPPSNRSGGYQGLAGYVIPPLWDPATRRTTTKDETSPRGPPVISAAGRRHPPTRRDVRANRPSQTRLRLLSAGRVTRHRLVRHACLDGKEVAARDYTLAGGLCERTERR